MKDKICLSLITDHLRDAKHCTAVQHGWTVSKHWPWDSSFERLKKELDHLRQNETYRSVLPASFSDIFDHLTIDVLGVTSDRKVYAVLSVYEDLIEDRPGSYTKSTTSRDILKSLISTYFALMLHFPVYRYQILFCSPLIHPGMEEEMIGIIERLNSELGSRHLEFRAFVNDSFYTEITEDPLLIT